MQRAFFRPDQSDVDRESPPLHSDDFEAMIQDTLAILADIDAVYDARRSAIAKGPAPENRKTRSLEQLQTFHRLDREPHVQLLADLHGRKMRLILFRTEH